MTDLAPASTPVTIDRIQSSRSGAGELRLRLSGRWLQPQGPAGADEELLVVQVEGRRHRFPASRDAERDAGDLEPGRWRASFTVPAWAEPRHDGQAALWLGNAVIPVPPLHGPHEGASPPAPARAPAAAVSKPSAEPSIAESKALPEPMTVPVPAAPAAPAVPVRAAPEPPAGASIETPRSGPLADLLLKETVSALHAELEQRTADAAQMRGALADSQSELEAGAVMQAQLETALGELRGELKRLIEAVEDQRRELERSRAEIERERAETDRRIAELAAARDERAAEFAALREQLAADGAGAERRAAEARELREDLASATVSRDAAISEVAGLRAELGRLGAELAVTRERVGSESGDLGEANRLLADARALTSQVRAQRERG